jgi:hypothetical protein
VGICSRFGWEVAAIMVDGVDFVVLANLSMRVEFVMPQLGVKTETIIFNFRESFSKFRTKRKRKWMKIR